MGIESGCQLADFWGLRNTFVGKIGVAPPVPESRGDRASAVREQVPPCLHRGTGRFPVRSVQVCAPSWVTSRWTNGFMDSP